MFRADRAQLGVLEPSQVEHVLRSWDRAAAEGRDDYWTRCERDAAPLGCAAAPSPPSASWSDSEVGANLSMPIECFANIFS